MGAYGETKLIICLKKKMIVLWLFYTRHIERTAKHSPSTTTCQQTETGKTRTFPSHNASLNKQVTAKMSGVEILLFSSLMKATDLQYVVASSYVVKKPFFKPKTSSFKKPVHWYRDSRCSSEWSDKIPSGKKRTNWNTKIKLPVQ